MKRILIYGLKEPIGGVENIVLSYAERFPENEIVCDYVMFGDSFSREPQITQRGGKVYYLPNRMRHRAEYRKALRAVFETNVYDAVWASLAGLTNVDVLRLAKAYGVPKRIAHAHGTRLYWSGALMRVLVPLLHHWHKPFIGRYVTDFWCCSRAAGEFLFPRAVHHKLTVIHNAVDTTVFSTDPMRREALRQQLGIESAKVVGHVARLSAEKNQAFLLDVFARVHAADSQTRLLIVGDGECRTELEKKVDELNLRNQVLFVGFRDDTADYYRACDVFVMPSVSEGLGVSLIEAQACGVPCVASTAVPPEADVTGAVRFVGLDEPIETWAVAIAAMMEQTVENPIDAVCRAQYDLKQESQKLIDFFTK